MYPTAVLFFTAIVVIQLAGGLYAYLIFTAARKRRLKIRHLLPLLFIPSANNIWKGRSFFLTLIIAGILFTVGAVTDMIADLMPPYIEVVPDIFLLLTAATMLFFICSLHGAVSAYPLGAKEA